MKGSFHARHLINERSEAGACLGAIRAVVNRRAPNIARKRAPTFSAPQNRNEFVNVISRGSV
jgi:hypothetical protein